MVAMSPSRAAKGERRPTFARACIDQIRVLLARANERVGESCFSQQALAYKVIEAPSV